MTQPDETPSSPTDNSLLNVGERQYQELTVSYELEWLRSTLGRIVRGGVYLLAGQPGIGKSTLALQLALDLGRRGIRSVDVLTEQSREEVAGRARQLCSAWNSEARQKALRHVDVDDAVYSVADLPQFLSMQILSPNGKYHGRELVIVDSVQGQGLAATATRQYRQVYEFCRHAKNAGITVILVAHVTKRGEIAGPKDLEHNVDCVLYMRRAFSYRPLFVPKNRYGPAVFTPVPLQMNRDTTTLAPSPLDKAVSSVARTFLGRAFRGAEAQATVQLPSFGSRGSLTAPGLPRTEVEQLLNCISQIPDLDIGDLSYTIQCRIPGEKRFRRLVGLPLAMALISSYVQRDIPSHHIYIGELDLLRRVREMPVELLQELVDAIRDREIEPPARIFLPTDAAILVKDELTDMTVVPCDTLERAIAMTWPDLQPRGITV
jgi:DNA repair protein RadA/Sms